MAPDMMSESIVPVLQLAAGSEWGTFNRRKIQDEAFSLALISSFSAG